MAIGGRIDLHDGVGAVFHYPARALRLEQQAAAFEGGDDGVHVRNLSSTGMLLETHVLLCVGEPLQVLLPEGETCTAIVVWANQAVYACEFDRMIPAAVIRSIAPLVTDGASGVRRDGTESAHSPVEETLGERIRRLRRARGFSMLRFAAKVGVSKPTLWKWERGNAVPRQELIGVIAATLGVSEREIIYGSEPSRDSGRLDMPGAGLPHEAIAEKKSELAQIMGISPERIRILIEA